MGLSVKKLDMVLMNDAWMQAYPQSYSVFVAGGCSDHLQCRIMIQQELMKPKRSFKFTNALTDMPEFKPLVESFWNSTDPLFNSTSALFRFSKKLKELKPQLRQLRRDKIGDVTKKTKEAWVKLCDCQTATLNNPNSDLMVEEAKAFDRWSFLSLLEEKILSQKAKVHWLSIGDGNNKQFYQAAKVREVRNSIGETKRRDGTMATTQDEIKVEAVSHFNTFLNHQPTGYSVTITLVLMTRR